MSGRRPVKLAGVLLLAPILFGVATTMAQTLPAGDYGGPTNAPLNSWSFYDRTNWTSDFGYAPISFTNLAYSNLGDFKSLVVDTNLPGWLQYNVQEAAGRTNLTVDSGTVSFWFGPDWASTDQGGVGPGEHGRLFEAGAYTTNSSYGWWSVYVDPAGTNLYFSAQTNDLSDTLTTYLSAPISWATNYFHFVALTYSPTNTALYLDGVFATNGPGVTVYPGADVLTNGFCIGSDSNGVDQAHGMFNMVSTFDYPLCSNDVYQIFHWEYMWIGINPFNTAMQALTSASSSPSYTPIFNVISGQGNLELLVTNSGCGSGSNAYEVWITNVTATAASNGTVNITFTIGGGASNALYDVFANSVLSSGTNGDSWAWMGQGNPCNIYRLNMPSTTCFLILGTPQQTGRSGLTDAYELLVAKVDPNNSTQTDAYGVPYAWYALNGLVPVAGKATQDPDFDGLVNWQEYMWGSKPNVSEGCAIWTSTPSGVLGIP